MISERAPDRRFAPRRVRLALAGALGLMLMLTACNTNGPYYRSSRGASSYESGRYTSYIGVPNHGSDDPVVAIVVVGLFVIPLIIKGIDNLAHWIW